MAASILMPAPHAEANSKYSAVVIDANTGTVIYSRYESSYRYPASLTKMMTLYLVFDALEKGTLTLDQKLKVSKRAAGQAPSKLWLKTSETLTVEQSIKALVTKSANDVATVLAESISGTEYKFALKMTEQAKQLGMYRTVFRNASGLPNRRQKSTAIDLATLARALYDHFPQYYPYFSTDSFTWKDKTYRSHNKLLKGYKGTDGIKTGYTRASGFNLTTSTKRDGVRLIGVVLGGRSSKTRDAHMKVILDRSYKKLASNPNLIPKMVNVPTPRLKPGSSPLLVALNTSPVSTLISSIDGKDSDLLPPLEETLAVDTTIEQGDQTPPPEWGIQIGAFTKAETAREHLIKAQATSPHLLRSKDALIMPLESEAGTIYRARFGPIGEEEAGQACVHLISKGMSCFAMNETNWAQS
jgi:D-alanyl-D-alanine carboxypeptidase